MTGQESLRETVQRYIEAEGLGPLAARTGLGIGQLRSISGGRAPLLTTVQQAVDALGLELYIGPPRAADLAERHPVARSATRERPSTRALRVREPVAYGTRRDTSPPPPTPVEGVSQVRDRALAEALAAIVGHWTDLGTRYARDVWIADLYRWCPALGARRSATSSRGSDGE